MAVVLAVRLRHIGELSRGDSPKRYRRLISQTEQSSRLDGRKVITEPLRLLRSLFWRPSPFEAADIVTCFTEIITKYILNRKKNFTDWKKYTYWVLLTMSKKIRRKLLGASRCCQYFWWKEIYPWKGNNCTENTRSITDTHFVFRW